MGETRPIVSPPYEARCGDGRCVVESLVEMAITGWAISAHMTPAELQVRCAGFVLPATVRRLGRADVSAHLGFDPAQSPPLGFVLELPPELWDHQRIDGSVDFHLGMGADDGQMPGMRVNRRLLDDWLNTLLTIEDGPTRNQTWLRAQPHFRRCFDPLQWEQAAQRWAAADAEHRSREQLPGAALKWTIESLDELRVVGWLAAPDGGDERFSVLCNGHELAAQVVRFERADVRDLLGLTRLESGFELALPAALWASIAPGETGQLQVIANGRRLLRAAMTLSRENLVAMVTHARQHPSHYLAPHDPDQRYRSLHLLEHIAAAGVAPELQADDAAFLRELAAVHHLAQRQPALASALARVAPAHRPTDEEEAIWQLQRAFNAALAPANEAVDAMVALEQLLHEARYAYQPRVLQRFLLSMVPYFCALSRLPALRPRLADAELRTLAAAEGCWELSLLLPVTVLDELSSATGRLGDSAALMERLAAHSGTGWLNTAAVLDALRRLDAAAPPALIDDAELDRFITAALRLFDSLGDGHASRLYDEQLVLAACHLLRLSEQAGHAMQQQVARGMLRHFGLAPGFWAALTLLMPDTQAWPDPLTAAHLHVDRLSSALRPASRPAAAAAPSRHELLQAVEALRAWGCTDIDSTQRHAALAVAPAGPDAADAGADPAPWLRGLPATDLLRWLGRHPEATAALLPAASLPWLLHEAGAPAPVNSPALRRAASQAVRALRAAVSQGNESAIALAAQAAQTPSLALAGERNGFIGLRGLATCCQLLTAEGQPRGRPSAAALLQTLAASLQRAFQACQRSPGRQPLPPAAAIAALSWLQLACHNQSDASLHAASAACTASLQSQWEADAKPGWTVLPRAARLAVDTPGVGLLVLVRCRGSSEVSAQIAGFRQRCAAGLLAGGIAWAAWQQQPGPTGSTGHGGPEDPVRIHAATLAALLGWLVQHSDFGQVMLLDDDAQLDMDALSAFSGYAAHHYHGQATAQRQAGHDALLDKSPAPTRFASIATGLTLSRHAAQRALALQYTARGARLARSSFDEEKWLADLLALGGIPLSDQGHTVHHLRPPRPSFTPTAFHDAYLPAPGLTTVLTHTPTTGSAAPPAAAGAALPAALRPRRLWPTDRAPRLASDGSGLQLVELSSPPKADALRLAECIVVAAARNERVLLPHFLRHYRDLGARHFVIIDNLSDDGSREYLLEQDDVVLYSADTDYRHARYGVAWQQTVLAAHGAGRWALLADIDEFLVWPGCETETLPVLCRRLDTQGFDAARVLMVDMYPEGPLEQADFSLAPPFAAAPCFDAAPMLPWRLGSGSFSNGPTWLSGLRHRLIQGSAPNQYTSQKVALVRHQPWVRFSEGLHYAAGLSPSGEALCFAHFKYHSGFRAKVLEEVARKQHYNDAEEYRQYQTLLSEAGSVMFDPAHSRRYQDSHSFSDLIR